MKAFFTLLLISLVASLRVDAQTYEWLKPKLANADTIVLASHEDFGSMIDKAGNSVAVPEWVVSGHPNYKALLKHKVLTPVERTELSRILLRPFRDKKITTMQCCQPHNILFIVRSGHTSYLDICFDCLCLDSSQDLSRLYVFDNRKWSELDKFFIKMGLEYVRR
jgi:hypothetical protein